MTNYFDEILNWQIHVVITKIYYLQNTSLSKQEARFVWTKLVFPVVVNLLIKVDKPEKTSFSQSFTLWQSNSWFLGNNLFDVKHWLISPLFQNFHCLEDISRFYQHLNCVFPPYHYQYFESLLSFLMKIFKSYSQSLIYSTPIYEAKVQIVFSSSLDQVTKSSPLFF